MSQDTITGLKSRIKTTSWYRQGVAATPLTFGYPYAACFRFALGGKRLSISYHTLVARVKNNFATIFLGKENLEEVARYYYDLQKEDHQCIQNLKKRWDEAAQTFRGRIREHESQDFSLLSDTELLQTFLDFNEAYMSLWSESIFLDSFDVAGETILLEAIKHEGKEIADKDLEVLTAVSERSWLQKEKYELLQLVEEALNGTKLFAFVRSVKDKGVEKLRRDFPDFYQGLERHAEKYHWIYYDYAVMNRPSPTYFFERIYELLEDKNEYEREKRELEWVQQIAAQKENIRERYGLSDSFMNVGLFLSALSKWRDDRKAHSQMAGGVIHSLGRELAKRGNLEFKDIEQMFWWEVAGILDPSKRATFVELTQKRLAGHLIYGDPTKNGIMYGSIVDEIVTLIERTLTVGDEVKGTPVYRGVVQGVIRIIRHQGEFEKMKQGDILVAPNTRPEYVPIMKLAGAVVSEEGGMTCHTAIVSRELKIPAVVGAQGALNILKDGDVVEVDAEKGVVRKV